jgi:hypothetical protein
MSSKTEIVCTYGGRRKETNEIVRGGETRGEIEKRDRVLKIEMR